MGTSPWEAAAVVRPPRIYLLQASSLLFLTLAAHAHARGLPVFAILWSGLSLTSLGLHGRPRSPKARARWEVADQARGAVARAEQSFFFGLRGKAGGASSARHLGACLCEARRHLIKKKPLKTSITPILSRARRR